MKRNPIPLTLGIRDAGCTACKVSPGDKDTCLTATGYEKAEMMIVTKLPMSAKNQAELEVYLVEAGIDPAKVAYTAVTKCLNWGVTPGKPDIKTCASLFLEKEVDMIKPSWILALGTEPLLALTGRSGITKYRGLEYEYRGSKVIPTISPSMVNRNPGMRDGFVADLRFFKRMVTGGELDPALIPPKIKYVTTENGLKLLGERLQTAYGMSYDIETNGFEEYKPGSKMVSLAVTLWDKGDSAPKEIWAVPLWHPESPFRKKWKAVVRYLSKFFRLPKVRVAHNGKFDQRWTAEFGTPFNLTFDTMIAQYLIDENKPKGLKPMAQTILGVEPWAISTKTLIETPLKKVIKYNGLDTWYAGHLYFKLREQLASTPRTSKLFKHLMIPSANEFVEIERTGLWTDRPLLQTRSKIAHETLVDHDEGLMEFIPDKSLWPPRVKEVNFNTSNFMRWLLFDHFEFPVLARGKPKPDGSPGDPSMAEGVIERLIVDHPHPFLDAYVKRGKWQKYDSSFFSAYQEMIDDNDRIHTTFKVTGTVTGRLSSGKGDEEKVSGRVSNRGVNLQQVPRDEFVKGIFGAPPGWAFIECDYSQIELRLAAYHAREETMLNLYRNGMDIHMTMAMRMTGKPQSEVTSEERKKAKAVNFGFLYGMGWKTFITTAWNSYGVVVTEEEAKTFRKAFFDEFPRLVEWHRRQRMLANKYGRVESPLGRVRHLPDIRSNDRSVKQTAERQAINSPIQSFASDMVVLALIALHREFRAKGLKARSVGTVHDACNFQVPIEELEYVIPRIKHHMENLPLEEMFGFTIDVPILGDVCIGRRWGLKQEIPSDVVTSPASLQIWLSKNGYSSVAA